MDTWQKVLNKVEEKIGVQNYNTWFKPTQFIRRDGSALYVRVPNSFFRDWLNEHIDVVLEAARTAEVGDIDVVYMIEEPAARPELPSQGSLDFESIDNTLNPKYTFETFVVGSSNQFAHAAALAVAERRRRPITRCSCMGEWASARLTSCTQSVRRSSDGTAA